MGVNRLNLQQLNEGVLAEFDVANGLIIGLLVGNDSSCIQIRLMVHLH